MRRVTNRRLALGGGLAAAIVLTLASLVAFNPFAAGSTSGKPMDRPASAAGAPPRSTGSTGDSSPADDGGLLPTEPGGPVASICGKSSVLNGPGFAPPGAVTVARGDNSALVSYPLPPNTTYWFAPGIHTIGTGQYAQIAPGAHDRFIGAPGAILSGQGKNDYAFGAPNRASTDVVIAYLTIQDFIPGGGNGAVNTGVWNNWTITHDTVRDNAPGAGVMLGTNNVLSDSCLTRNGEYGFQTYTVNDVSPLTHGSSNVTVTHNEISYNDTCNWEALSPDPVPAGLAPTTCRGAGQYQGCGCGGGAKFWQTDGALVTDNYVHDNFDVGLWADTNNNGFTVDGNYIAHNYGEGFMYEISYNALVEKNIFVDNAWGAGVTNGGFPTGAIYISESGGDSRVPNPAGITTITISRNVFTDNWSGVVLWENSNRFCGSPDNPSSGDCTLVAPRVAKLSTCTRANLANASPKSSPDYYDLCRWKTQNVSVSGNTFNMDPGHVPGCEGTHNSCGENAIISEWCSNSSNGIGWSPYCAPHFAIADAVANPLVQHNVLTGNTYHGVWSFMVHDQGTVVDHSTWHGPHGNQDRGSTFG